MTPSVSAYLRAAQMVTEGANYADAARAYGVDRSVLRRFRPRRVFIARPQSIKVRPKKERATEPKPMNERVREIVGGVANEHGLSLAEITGERRHRFIAWPRQEAMWRLYQHTSFSLPAIGRLMGGRDHTTVLHGIRAFEARLRPWLDVMEVLARAV
ncbi:MAG: hypothetical protein EON87_05250 [Brevundimonas sp.]|nr:MAG: hypothetical protein EON87_05250 [Brevundimonas sp.]